MTASACFSVSLENRNPHRLSEVDCASGRLEYRHGGHLQPKKGRQSLEGWGTVWAKGGANARRVSLVGAIEVSDTVRVDDVSTLGHML